MEAPYSLVFIVLSAVTIHCNDNLVMDLQGTIGPSRHVMIQNNLITATVTPPISSRELLGSVQINLFNNQMNGSLILTSSHFNTTNNRFEMVNLENESQFIETTITCSRNQNGVLQSQPSLLPNNAQSLIRATSSNIINEVSILYFFTSPNPGNSSSSGTYQSAYQLTWIN